MSNSELIIYQTEDDRTQIETRLEDETVWLTQAQLCELFQKSKATISEHISNIFVEGELDANSVVRNFRTTAADGKSYDTRFYNLDVIISVGYRVKSVQGTKFRHGAYGFDQIRSVRESGLDERDLASYLEGICSKAIPM